MNETRQFVKIGLATDVPDGTVQVFTVKDKRIAVCQYQGQFYAIDDRCTHDNGPLGEGELVDDGQIECPRHAARFDIKTGKAMCLPAIGAVSTYSIDVREGELWLAIPTGP